MIVALACGVAAALALAAALWVLALSGARRRAIPLGLPPFVLVALVALAGAAAHAHPAALALASGALVAGAVDARTGYIFHEVTGGIVAATAAGAIAEGVFLSSAVSALAFVTILTLVVVTYAKVRSRQGLGHPDIALVGAIALGLGAWYGYIAVVAAFTLGALYALALVVRRGARRTDEMRFGPFLAGGALVGTLAQTFAIPGVIR